MKLVEVFQSIQGEGFWMGIPVIFVRTRGCNLKCKFCDTKNSWSKDEGADYTPEEVFALATKDVKDINHIVITGGEPLLWGGEMQALITLFEKNNYMVGIESNGTYPRPANVNHFVVSPKPDSKYVYPGDADELKFVVTEDFESSIITEGTRKSFAGRIWLQPDGFHMKEAWKKCYQMAMEDPRLRVGVQLHKLMEVQ